MKRKPTPALAQIRLDSHRGQWRRKPTTQVQANKKAEQRRTYCRKSGKDDGAVPFSDIIMKIC